MFDLEAICTEVEKTDPVTYARLIEEKRESVLAGITAIVGDAEEASTMLTMLVFGAVLSDGKFDEKEFGLVKPLIEEICEEELTYEEALEFMTAIKAERKSTNPLLVALVEMFGLASDELKNDTVMLCLLVCAADGKITKREKNWLAKLIG